MQWSFKAGKILGIEFRIHITFPLLLLFIYLSEAARGGVEQGLRAVLFVSAIFASVLIHEIGHALIARRYGKEAKSITLLPIGGIATMEEMPEKPIQEITMALVGPFINLAIAGILYIFIGGWSGIGAPHLSPGSTYHFLTELINVNIILAVFNLIPAFPMDGGRVLRGFLASRMDYVKATSTAVSIGQVLAMFFIFFGIFFNWWLALIGFFLYVGAGSEKQQVMLRSVLHRVPASEAMVTDFQQLKPNEMLSEALEHIYHGCQEDFPVVGNRGVEGILTRMRVLSAIHERNFEIPVAEIMDRNFLSADLRTPLDDIYQKLSTSNKTSVVVTDNGRLKGMLCLDNISRFFMLKSASRGMATNVSLPESWKT